MTLRPKGKETVKRAEGTNYRESKSVKASDFRGLLRFICFNSRRNSHVLTFKSSVTRTQPIAQRFEWCYSLLMSMPPTHFLHDLGPQAQMMSKNANNEKVAMLLQYVAVGSMIIMAGVAASHVLRDAFGSSGHHRRRDRDPSR